MSCIDDSRVFQVERGLRHYLVASSQCAALEQSLSSAVFCPSGAREQSSGASEQSISMGTPRSRPPSPSRTVAANEDVCSLASVKFEALGEQGTFVVGTAIHNPAEPEEEPKKGRILVFTTGDENRSLEMVASKEVKQAVMSIVAYGEWARGKEENEKEVNGKGREKGKGKGKEVHGKGREKGKGKELNGD